jgi:hypothetical protein
VGGHTIELHFGDHTRHDGDDRLDRKTFRIWSLIYQNVLLEAFAATSDWLAAVGYTHADNAVIVHGEIVE